MSNLRQRHFEHLVQMGKHGAVTEAIIRGVGNTVGGAALGASIAALRTNDPSQLKDSMIEGALLGGGVGGGLSLISSIPSLAQRFKNSQTEMGRVENYLDDVFVKGSVR